MAYAQAEAGGGQILLVTAGRGYYQEWGKPAQELHPGDVVNIPAGVKHWHGAAKNSWFAHLAVEVPGRAWSYRMVRGGNGCRICKAGLIGAAKLCSDEIVLQGMGFV